MNHNKISSFEDLKNMTLDLEPDIAKIKKNDSEITGGRYIKNVKSNRLFTGKFEENDLNNFIGIWQNYRNNNKASILPLLMSYAKDMIRNYHGEVCPIEVMLYTSNIIATSFSLNKKLMDSVADAVCNIIREREYFIESLKHILKVWNWEQAINICEIAAGKIAASRNNEDDIELLKYIYDNFHYQENLRYGCFYGLLLSKKEEFVLDILDMIHDLKDTQIDKQIGNLFKNLFVQNFPDHYTRLDKAMFFDSNAYVQDLIRKLLIQPANNVELYKNAPSKEERRRIVDSALNRILKNDSSMSPYEAINVLKLADSESISEQLFLNLGINGKKPRQYPKFLAVAVIRNYFGSINYPPAIKIFSEIKPPYEYYAAVRQALFFQNKIDGDTILADFLSSEETDQVQIYVDGFFGFNEKDKELRRSVLNYLSQNLSEEKLSTAITNYYRLIQKYRRRFYDPQVGDLIKSWFGYKTILQAVPLKLQDQMTCLNIIDNIIDDFNYKTYEDFLYYVAEENLDFSPSVSNLAKKILKNIKLGGIRKG